ncbi:hypothetical protein [Pseudomonas sp. GD03696]|uniref:hypothetical protein n=1 Tax=Pseudomonas sp. GD03696 TaxID=2975368 RepID=UPI00244A1574|nr:hypothetical protein [Pseudomonas sp. GD03696]MDH1930376.1 hypothetical protein [Pseudomonas sp. GD03696]
MPKRNRENGLSALPTDRLNSTEVSSILGIHRNTLKRMALTGSLSPDGTTGGGRNYWLRSNVDLYRLGALTSTTVWYIQNDLLGELQISHRQDARILGQRAARISLPATNRTACLAALLTFIATEAPHALALPAINTNHQTNRLIADVCCREGVSVILVPS